MRFGRLAAWMCGIVGGVLVLSWALINVISHFGAMFTMERNEHLRHTVEWSMWLAGCGGVFCAPWAAPWVYRRHKARQGAKRELALRVEQSLNQIANGDKNVQIQIQQKGFTNRTRNIVRIQLPPPASGKRRRA